MNKPLTRNLTIILVIGALLLLANATYAMNLPGLTVTLACNDFTYTAFTIEVNRDNTGSNTEAYRITVTDGQGTVLHSVQNLGGLPLGTYGEGAGGGSYNQGATALDNVRTYTWLSLAGNGLPAQTAYTVTNPDCTGGGPVNVALNASATCNGADLQVTINAGDGPFNISGTGAGLPSNGVNTGTTTLTGPNSWTGVTVTETGGDGETINLGNFDCTAPTVALNATAVCNGADLQIDISAGDGPFNISGAGAGLPANGVNNGTTTLTGPGSWTGVTVTETGGDGESVNVGDFNCAAPVGPGYGSSPAPNGTINFGLVVLGNSQTRSLIVNESGGAQLDVALNGGSIATAITGANAADFTITAPAFPFSIADGGANQTVTLQCTPGALGVRSAALTLTTNDAVQPTVTYNLTCQGASITTSKPVSSSGNSAAVNFPAPPSVPLCASMDGSTNDAVRANVPAGIVTDGSAFCRIIDSQVEIGNADVISQGVLNAVDIFGMTWTGNPATRFNLPMTVCLQGTGSMVFLDAAQSPRIPQTLPATSSGGYTCGTIPGAGTVVLVNGPAAPDAPAQTATPAVTETALNGCRVTTTHAVRLRTAPDTTSSSVITTLPFNITLDATALSGGWFRVIYESGQGWVSGDYVNTIGNCG